MLAAAKFQIGPRFFSVQEIGEVAVKLGPFAPCHHNYVKKSVAGVGRRDEVKIGPDVPGIERFEQDIIVGEILAVEPHADFFRFHALRFLFEDAQNRINHMSRLARLSQIAIFLAIELQHRFGEQAEAETLDETLRTPGTAGQSSVEVHASPVFPAGNEFLKLATREPERLGDVVGSAGRQDRDRRAATYKLLGDLSNGSIAAGDGDDVAGFLERLFPFFLFGRLVIDFVPGGAQQLNDLLARRRGRVAR